MVDGKDLIAGMTTCEDPSVRLLVVEAATAEDLLWSLRSSGVVALALRGKRMRTTIAVMGETAAALQFPYYFGENWPAMDECLNDLEWLPPGPLMLLVTDAQLVASADDAQFAKFVKVLRSASKAWSEGGNSGGVGRPFHAILQCPPGQESLVRERLGFDVEAASWPSV